MKAFGQGLSPVVKKLIQDLPDIPKYGLSRLSVPGRQVLTGYPPLQLGPELIYNNDFHDFTMSNDANTVGHWIFDKYYHDQEASSDITDDLSGNANDLTPNNFSTDFIDEYLPNGKPNLMNSGGASSDTDWEDSNGDGVPNYWVNVYTASTEVSIVRKSANRGVRIKLTQEGGTSLFRASTAMLEANHEYDISFRYRCSLNSNKYIQMGTGNFTEFQKISGDSFRIYDTNNNEGAPAQWSGRYKAQSSSWFGFRYPSGTAGNWIEIYDLEVKQVAEVCYQNGGHLSFDGVNQYMQIPSVDADDFNMGTGDFTAEYWFRVPENITNTALSFKADDAPPTPPEAGWGILLLSNYYMYLYFSDGTNGKNGMLTTNLESYIGKWVHIACVFDRDVGLHIYINGELSETWDITNAQGDVSSSSPFNISKIDGAAYYTNGDLYEIRISNVARSAETIMQSCGLAKGWDWRAFGDNIIAENDGFTQKVTDSSTSSAGGLYSQNSSEVLASDKLYMVEIKVKGVNYFSAFLDFPTHWYFMNNFTLSDSEYKTFRGFINGQGAAIDVQTGSNVSGNTWYQIEYVSVKEVLNVDTLGDDYLADYAKGGLVLDSELIVNGGFDSGDNWVCGAPWTISGGKAHYDDTTSNFMTQSGFTVSLNDLLCLEFTISGLGVDKQARIGFYNQASEVIVPYEYYGNGSFKFYAFSQASSTGLRLYGNTGSTDSWDLDNVSIKKVLGYNGEPFNGVEDNDTTHPYAINFNGVDQYIEFPNTNLIDFSESITFGWVRRDGSEDVQVFFSTYAGSNDGINFYINNDDYYAKVVYNDGADFIQDIIVDSCDDRWHFFAMVVSESGGFLHNCINDEDTLSWETSNAWSPTSFDVANDLVIGARADNYDFPAEASIGINGQYIFSSAVPSNYQQIIQAVFDATKHYYLEER